MKNTLRVEYNSVSKRYEVFTETGAEIGRIYRSGKEYEVYLDNRFIGRSTSPYTGKQLIFDNIHPDAKRLREESKQARDEARQRKEAQKQKDRADNEEKRAAAVAKMNGMRENDIFKQSFYKAAITVFPEYKDSSIESVCEMGRIMMNGIALHIIGGNDEISKAIKRGGNEGKMLALMVDGGLLD